jgi:adenylate kinase family enzyme
MSRLSQPEKLAGTAAGRLVRSRFVRRISVVGCSGSGKSTVGRRLARDFGVPFIELDSIYHQPGWVPLPREEFRRRVAEVTAADGWVIDGNYSSSVQDLVWARADTVIWLDLPRRTVMRQVVWRTVRRAAFRVELWNGNRERWANLLTWEPEDSVISWSWHHYPVYRERYGAAAAAPPYPQLNFVRLRSHRAIRRFLDDVS